MYYRWQREYWYWYLRWLRGYVPLGSVRIPLPANVMSEPRCVGGHTPPVEEGRCRMPEWPSDTSQRARPRSAVTVSLAAPSLARLTRSVRAEGRVDPGSSPGTWHLGYTASGVELHPTLGFTGVVRYV